MKALRAIIETCGLAQILAQSENFIGFGFGVGCAGALGVAGLGSFIILPRSFWFWARFAPDFGRAAAKCGDIKASITPAAYIVWFVNKCHRM